MKIFIKRILLKQCIEGRLYFEMIILEKEEVLKSVIHTFTLRWQKKKGRN